MGRNIRRENNVILNCLVVFQVSVLVSLTWQSQSIAYTLLHPHTNHVQIEQHKANQ